MVCAGLDGIVRGALVGQPGRDVGRTALRERQREWLQSGAE
jgi:hypothetical protein